MRLLQYLSCCLVVTASGCGSRAPAPAPAASAESAAPAGPDEPRRFVGHYESGWEKQVFRPCGTGEEWWTWSTRRIVPDDPRGWGRAFVVLRGHVSPPGRYGHMGRYPRQIAVTEVVEVLPASTDCPTSI